MQLVVVGKLNKQVASDLGTTEITFKTQRGRVMRKMETDSLADLPSTLEKRLQLLTMNCVLAKGTAMPVPTVRRVARAIPSEIGKLNDE